MQVQAVQKVWQAQASEVELHSVVHQQQEEQWAEALMMERNHFHSGYEKGVACS